MWCFLEVLAHFPRQSYNIIALFWVVTVGTNFEVIVQHFGGTEIKEQTCNLLQKNLERVLWSFAHFPV
jgi:hypothetical protein